MSVCQLYEICFPLLFQIIVFQTYTNQSHVPIEAKYIFPLDDKAAVCGFEAFINGKHIVGEVRGGRAWSPLYPNHHNQSTQPASTDGPSLANCRLYLMYRSH